MAASSVSEYTAHHSNSITPCLGEINQEKVGNAALPCFENLDAENGSSRSPRLSPKELDTLPQLDTFNCIATRASAAAGKMLAPRQPSISFTTPPKEICSAGPLSAAAVAKPEEVSPEQAAEDQALILFYRDIFRALVDRVRNVPRPQKNPKPEDATQTAANIRTWMWGNQSALDLITSLYLRNHGENAGLNSFTLPSEISLLRNLERLYSNDWVLTKLPDDLNLPNLKILILDETALEELPPNLYLPQLKVLSLAKTELRTLGRGFNLLPKLHTLNLNDCPIKELPDNFNPPALQVLSIEGTNIEELPADLDLQSLHVIPRTSKLGDPWRQTRSTNS